MHSTQYILLGRLAHRILLIIRQEDHVLPCVSKVTIEVCRHVFDIINASSQLPFLTEVVDTDQQCLSSAGTVRVLEIVPLGRALAKAVLALRRWGWGLLVTLDVGIRVHGR